MVNNLLGDLKVDVLYRLDVNFEIKENDLDSKITYL